MKVTQTIDIDFGENESFVEMTYADAEVLWKELNKIFSPDRVPYNVPLARTATSEVSDR